MTQEEIARRLGVHQCTVSAWENGAPMSPHRALRVVSRWGAKCRELGVTVESLVRQGRNDGRRNTSPRRMGGKSTRNGVQQSGSGRA